MSYAENNNKPTNTFGPCPKCHAPESKITWGWAGVYYDMVCPNDHLWTYKFPDRVGCLWIGDEAAT